MVDALCLAATSKTREFDSQGIANTLYALSIFAHYDDNVWSPLFEAFSNILHLDSNALSIEDHSQIHLVLLTLSLENPDLLSKLRYPSTLKELCSTSHVAQFSLSVKSSIFHLSVSQLLTEMSISHENEFVASGFLSVDIFIKSDISQQQQDGGRNEVIIEVDGPTHYLRGSVGSEMVGKRTSKLCGEHLLKDRLLEKQGYNVLHIPYYEWNALNSAVTKRDYLKRLMT